MKKMKYYLDKNCDGSGIRDPEKIHQDPDPGGKKHCCSTAIYDDSY
jgi:hypothetical protein